MPTGPKSVVRKCPVPECGAKFHGPRAGQALGGHMFQKHRVTGRKPRAGTTGTPPPPAPKVAGKRRGRPPGVKLGPGMKRKYTRRAQTPAIAPTPAPAPVSAAPAKRSPKPTPTPTAPTLSRTDRIHLLMAALQGVRVLESRVGEELAGLGVPRHIIAAVGLSGEDSYRLSQEAATPVATGPGRGRWGRRVVAHVLRTGEVQNPAPTPMEGAEGGAQEPGPVVQ